MSYKGNLLIAKPGLNDEYFSKSVIYLTGDDPFKGSVGVVLNKLYEKKLNEIIPEIDLDMDVYMGGPVNQDHLFVIHSRPDLISKGTYIGKDYYWSGNYKEITLALKNKWIENDEIRFFIGYTGWKYKQLRTEINNKDWMVLPDKDLNILKWEDNLWKNKLIKADKRNIIWVNYPTNPLYN
ncbi:YqgE/AlgH family protein [Apibacter muscae]|uniref:YqgE/AlgH family protein n=1 Tax=Apibacter muscae TaxID=2509004 RepID=UPI0011ADED9A|nr:YqgE/AlgH family protein [Apibacter muscae]TWP22949.1 YqgE/AlgH family protein [Apibacter muscae]